MSSGSSKSQQAPQTVPPVYTFGMAGTKGETNQTFTPWEQAAPAYGELASRTNALAAQNPEWVGPSQQTQQGLEALYGAIPGMNQVGNTAMDNYKFLSQAADVANNPYVQGMVGANQQSVNKQLTEQWLPALAGNAVSAGSGSMGSSRAGLAQGNAVGNAAQQLGQANASLLNTAYGQGLTAQQHALSSLGAVQQGMLMPAQALQAAGQQMEGYEQNRINAPWQHLQNVGAALQYTNPLGNLRGSSQGQQVTDSGPQGSFDPFTMGRGQTPSPDLDTGGRDPYNPYGRNPRMLGRNGSPYSPYGSSQRPWQGYY